jgi:UV DNA damage endonuclease
MLRHLGYVVVALSLGVTTAATCRLANATPARLRALIASNLDNLARVLAFNAARDIRLYRISSDVVPFASHPVNRLRWWRSFGPRLRALGAVIRRNDMRVSMHPGQFTVLSSLNPAVVRASVLELAWHARFLDALGADAASKIVIHVGSMADGPQAGIARFVRVARRLPAAVRRRLIVENDERLYTAEHALAVSRQTGLPVVFDWLHHRANPGGATTPAATARLVADCFDTWGAGDGVPKVHLSSQARGGRLGQHAGWVHAGDMLDFLAVAPPRPFDCMIEAKQKDRALFRLRRDLARAGVVEAGLRRRAGRPGAPGARRAQSR